MEIDIFSHKIAIQEAPVHVAPGGSELICLKGKSSSIRKLLIDTREQLAYGMIKAEVHDVSDECVWVWIYIGKADMDEWLEIHRNEENTVEFERSDLDGEAWKMGYSMATRNQVIEALKG